MSEAPPYWLFSYGTLQLRRVQTETFGRALAGSPDVLIGFRIDEVEIDDPDVVATSGRAVHPILRRSPDLSEEISGTAFQVTDEDLRRADLYETSAYARVEVTLTSGRRAFVYVAADDA